MTRDEKVAFIAARMKEILSVLGMPCTDDSTIDTPTRVAKMYVDELFYGNLNLMPEMRSFDVPKKKASDVVYVSDIAFSSLCEHHLLPVVGTVHIAYYPNKNLFASTARVLGLSKFSRIVKFLAAKPQLQEGFTQEILNTVAAVTKSSRVAVIVKAKHSCVSMRGVQDSCSNTTTFAKTTGFSEKMYQKFLHSISL